FVFCTLNDAVSSVKMSIDGEQVAEASLPNTGWGLWTSAGPNIQLSAGVHVLTLEFTGGPGFDYFEFEKVNPLSFPNGTPHVLGRIEGEDFDQGGIGVAWSGNDPGWNTQGGDYRRVEDGGINAKIQAGGYSNGFALTPGTDEWYNYTLAVPETGEYYFSFTGFFVENAPHILDLLIDDDLAATTPSLTSGNWTLYTKGHTRLHLTEGVHTLTVKINHGGFLLDYITYTKYDPIAYPDGVPHNPGIVEAENFDKGGEFVGYHDLDGSNNAVPPANYRTDNAGVGIMASTSASNGHLVVATRDGEWLSYVINVPEAGTYKFSFATTNNQMSALELTLDDAPIGEALLLGTDLAIVETDGPSVALTAGKHILIIKFSALESATPGFDYFKFVKE
ncbi:MAG: carbohydrate-binding protein, partial [Tannerella sp.]|nr:carbohydrate-binding protein [Tannerella sp.]